MLRRQEIAWLLLQTVSQCIIRQAKALLANWRAESTNTYSHKCEFRLVIECLAVLVSIRQRNLLKQVAGATGY